MHRYFKNPFQSSLIASWLAIIAVLFVYASPIPAKAQDCVKTENILTALREGPVLKGKPCDAIGKGFWLGISGRGRIAAAAHPTLEEEDLYYIIVRTYLADELEYREDEWPMESFLGSYAQLVVSREILPDFEGSPNRRWAYEMFPTFAYGQYALIRSSYRDLLVRLLLDEFENTDLNTGRKLYCFIKFDVPVLSEDAVIASTHYQNCINEQ